MIEYIKAFVKILKSMWNDTENEEAQNNLCVILLCAGFTLGVLIRIIWGMF